jgi:hypothetical protein
MNDVAAGLCALPSESVSAGSSKVISRYWPGRDAMWPVYHIADQPGMVKCLHAGNARTGTNKKTLLVSRGSQIKEASRNA